MTTAGELDRIRAEYARRDRDPAVRDRYSPFRPDALFAAQTRERAVLRLLGQAGYEPLDRVSVLDVGCGEGGVLADLIRWGADPARLCGCDLLPGRVGAARRVLPAATRLAVADGGALPYPAASFDLVLQFTMLTSVLDDPLRQRIAAEMWRVLRPDGAILSYDFRFRRPDNPAVQAIQPRELCALFPQGACQTRRVTLAPPIARALARWSWLACELLAWVPWLRTHDLILIRKTEA